ncbi:3-deoxy-D-manno-octulosonic-acid transferase [Rhodovulum bhavnagarense]|uniref:3-deoxy-D-manno-octulosonic acid transferase n=1 Tax=Rhodovulum bhavnagarense TaxID=992286 RepID=A0A4V2SWK7_9RHOB|nr:glycosyltransferase N-terminal domain-containing protein [Rhodovulum bhavnagarense]TCP62876.1 3-deoxy-D-manno-octulosonic-acid transferase [Rhodovulum bhavnagarense]
MKLYRLILLLAAPLIGLRLARRRDEAAERLGGTGPSRLRRGPVIWLHAASNGEVTSARGLITVMHERLPTARMVVTCNTVTGRNLVRGWALDRVEARLAPLDYRIALRRFIAAWQPDSLILIESELWPNRLAEMARLGRPVVMLGARMSAKSASRWAYLPGLIRPALAAVSYLSAQDSASRERFIALGLDEGRAGPVVNLKSGAYPEDEVDAAVLDRLKPLFAREATLLAASTHDGEEGVILTGFARARRANPMLRLILAPRHPRRAPEIAKRIARMRLPFATRSRGEFPGAETAVYLADTMGEMGLWYRLAGMTFVGGSLVDKGGHTPFEPVAHDSAILHGPHVGNFTSAYGALTFARAARRIANADELAEALAALDADEQAGMADRARAALDRIRDSGKGLDPLLAELSRLMGEPALARPAPDQMNQPA